MRLLLSSVALSFVGVLSAAAADDNVTGSCPFYATPGSWSPGDPVPTENLAEYYVEGVVLNWDADASSFTSPRPFQDMPLWDFHENPGPKNVSVQYQTMDLLGGCTGNLRQYVFEGVNDGSQGPLRPVAPQLEFRPGDSLDLVITNNLPADGAHPGAHAEHQGSHALRLTASGEEFEDVHGHHGTPAASSEFGYIAPLALDKTANEDDPIYNMIHGLNNTNIHTHGWNVSPRDNSDNVFVSIQPGDEPYEQVVYLDAPGDVNDTGHPSGLFWYHAHKHGATAVQVSSGMAGTLVVRDLNLGLDAALEEIDPSMVEKTFMLQQLPYDENGAVENINYLQENVKQTGIVEPKEDHTNAKGKACNLGAAYANRPPFVNGVATPELEIDLNQVYRFRFLHSGSIGGISPQVVASPQLPDSLQLKSGKTLADITLPLYEIATDGLPTGTIIPQQNIPLQAAYRSDALFQVTPENLNAAFSNLDLTSLGSDGYGAEYVYLYLIDQGQSVTRTVPSCATPNAQITNARRLLAVLKVAIPEFPVDELGADYSGLVLERDYTTERMTGPLAQALADYQVQGWAEPNLGNHFGYRDISALPEIGDAELKASASRYCRHDDATASDVDSPSVSSCEPTAFHDPNTSVFEDVAIETVHYFGDGGKKYHCPLTGGRCTYCGGAVSEYEGEDGNIYNANSTFQGVEQPAICSEKRPSEHPDGMLPKVNFMICDRVVDTPAQLDPTSGVYNAAGTQMCTNSSTSGTQTCYCGQGNNSATQCSTSNNGTVNANLAPATPVDIPMKAGESAKAWSCMLFDTAADYIRNVELYSANEWQVSSANNAGHVFHIHVNPFVHQRPAGTDFFQASYDAYDVWKDTMLAPSTGNVMRFPVGQRTHLKTRYSYYSGAYVQHCHVLTHEDQGMMQVVSVSDPNPFNQLMAMKGFETKAETRAYLSEVLYADGPMSAMQIDTISLEGLSDK